MYQITKTDIEAVKKYGAKVFCITERFAVPLPALAQPCDFINPKDAGTDYGQEHLYGNGNDVLLFNGLSDSQGQKINAYLQKFPLTNAEQIRDFLAFAANIGTNDMYASDTAYLQKAFEAPAHENFVGFYTRRRDIIYRAARLNADCVLKNNGMTQYADDGALLIVPQDNSSEQARLTNVPTDYQTLSGDIPDLATLKRLV